MAERNSGTQTIMSRVFVLPLLLTCFASSVVAQTSSGKLRGTITDPSGAVIPKASVTVTGLTEGKSATTSHQGGYEIRGLAAGKYTVRAAAKGFATHESREVEIIGGQIRKLDITLVLEVVQKTVVVQDQTSKIGIAPTQNANSLVLRRRDLEALSDDPDELKAELQALAGPRAGPNGGQIYIDGFTGGRLPPKASIREVRINQNPFSAEYAELGYGRIEVLTEPGTNQYHGQFLFNETGSFINSKNPLVPADVQPAYQTPMFNAALSGPLNKRATFFFNAERRNFNGNNIVLAPAVGVEQGIPNPQRQTNIGSRLDYQLSANNNLTVRYQFAQDNQDGAGVGGLSLASQAFDVNNTEQTLQISDTQILSSRTINETRFQYVRDRNNQFVLDLSPTINVLGAFVGGGSSVGNVVSHQDHFELQNYTSMAPGNHMLKFGGRLREVRDALNSNANFNGSFTFSSMGGYCPTGAQFPCPAPGLPSQFSIVTGQPTVRLSLFDAGLFMQDDWSIRPNMTLSAGLRFETQTQVHDHADFAPRLAFAWGLSRRKTPPKTVLRAGFGIFYDRFTDSLLLQAKQLNGINQQEYIVSSPTFFPAIPPLSSVGAKPVPTNYQVDPRLRAPYVLQSAVTVERQLPKQATMAITYLNSRGFDQLVLRNVNAPLPITGMRPLGNFGNIYQYESAAVFSQNQLVANFRVNAGSKLSLFGFYSLSYANGDTGAGASTASSMSMASIPTTVNFLSNQYNIRADYGRTAFDIRHQFALGGTVTLPYAFRLSPFLLASSGQPFNITVGQDLNGDSIFNDRPSFATGQQCGGNIQCTSLGTFNVDPGPNDVRIPINYGTGTGQFTFNLNLSKSFDFGRRLETTAAAGGPDETASFYLGNTTNRRYSLTFTVAASNLLNNVNLAPPIGVLSSPTFGKGNALASGSAGTPSANRTVDLQLMFTF